MNDNRKTIEIAERVLLFQSQIDALKELILSQSNALSLEQLDRKMFALQSQIQMGQKYRERLDEFRRAIQSQENAVALLHSLHDYALHRMGF